MPYAIVSNNITGTHGNLKGSKLVNLSEQSAYRISIQLAGGVTSYIIGIGRHLYMDSFMSTDPRIDQCHDFDRHWSSLGINPGSLVKMPEHAEGG